MDDLRYRYPVIISMLVQGTSPAEVCRLMSITDEEWETIDHDPLFEEAYEAALTGDQSTMTPEEVLQRAEATTGEAFSALESVISDPRSGAGNRLRAAAMAFDWRTELNKRKTEADNRIEYNLVIDRRAVTRMEAILEMLNGQEGRAWLQQASQIMPNSTV